MAKEEFLYFVQSTILPESIWVRYVMRILGQGILLPCLIVVFRSTITFSDFSSIVKILTVDGAFPHKSATNNSNYMKDTIWITAIISDWIYQFHLKYKYFCCFADELPCESKWVWNSSLLLDVHREGDGCVVYSSSFSSYWGKSSLNYQKLHSESTEVLYKSSTACAYV